MNPLAMVAPGVGAGLALLTAIFLSTVGLLLCFSRRRRFSNRRQSWCLYSIFAILLLPWLIASYLFLNRGKVDFQVIDRLLGVMLFASVVGLLGAIFLVPGIQTEHKLRSGEPCPVCGEVIAKKSSVCGNCGEGETGRPTDDGLVFDCEYCRHRISLPLTDAGRIVDCPHCGKMLDAPLKS